MVFWGKEDFRLRFCVVSALPPKTWAEKVSWQYNTTVRVVLARNYSENRTEVSYRHGYWSTLASYLRSSGSSEASQVAHKRLCLNNDWTKHLYSLYAILKTKEFSKSSLASSLVKVRWCEPSLQLPPSAKTNGKMWLHPTKPAKCQNEIKDHLSQT